MSRISKDVIVNGVVKDGFDYDLQVWVKDYIIQDCGHREHPCCNPIHWLGKILGK